MSISSLIERVKPRYPDHTYYVRVVEGCFVATAFFTVSAIMSFLAHDRYQDYQYTSGNTSYYASKEVLAGSVGQGYVGVVFAVIALLAGLVVVAWKWRFGWADAASAFGLALMGGAVMGGFIGLFLSGGIQHLLLGETGLRQLYWGILPVLGVGAVIGVLVYAKDGTGTFDDLA